MSPTALKYIAGAALIAFGLLGMLGGTAFPILFIVVGAAIIVRARRNN